MKIAVYVDRRQGDSPWPVKIRVSRPGGSFLVSTGLTCHTEVIGQTYSRREPDGKVKTSRLNEYILAAEKAMLENPGLPTPALRDRILEAIGQRPKAPEKMLADYITEFSLLKERESTRVIYRQLRDKVVAYDRQATLDSVTPRWLAGLERRERGNGMSVNGLAIKLRALRAVFNYAIDNNYTTNYPFRKYKIKHEETRKRALTLEQFAMIRDWPVAPWQERYRDMFVLMFYLMGINAADLFTLERLDHGRVVYRRRKTGRIYDFKCPKEALEIIKRYPGKRYLLSPLDDYKDYHDYLHHMNDALKTIGVEYNAAIQRVGGEPLFPDLSSYWARHTWGTAAASLDIPLETIAACLGHSSSSVTQIYIKFDSRKIDKANRRVIDAANELRLDLDTLKIVRR